MARFQGAKVTWFGHSAFKVDTPGGKVVLIDPWLDHPAAPAGAKESIQKADLIVVTHGHGDHIGNTVEIARNTGATVVAIYEITLYLSKKGLTNLVGMNIGGTYRHGDLAVTMVEATHSAAIDDNGTLIPGGDPTGIILTLENGFRIYHMGDTGLIGTLDAIRELYHPDLLLVPIGSLFTLGPEEAAYVVRKLDPRWIIPMHYKTFPVLTGTPEEFRNALAPEYRDRLIVLNPGETAE